MDESMKVQERIMKDYMNLFDKPTILQLSRDCGIQKTRVFRLINGMEMRLSEYLILKDRILKLTSTSSDLQAVANECEYSLGRNEVRNLHRVMERRLRRAKLLASKHEMVLVA